ncbi:hypothetical protein CLM81_26305, partial [Streptomyces albidoflavus]
RRPAGPGPEPEPEPGWNVALRRLLGDPYGMYVNGLDLCGDLGLIAVSTDEVGVFWSVGACRGGGSGRSGCPASRPSPGNTSVDFL